MLKFNKKVVRFKNVLLFFISLHHNNKQIEIMKTYLVIFKSGRQDKFFADSIKELKKMCTWENVKDLKVID